MENATINFDVANMDSDRRDAIRLELAHELEYIEKRADNYSISNTIVGQYIETAIHATDAVSRVAVLAEKMAKNGPIASAAAEMIRNALKGV